MQNKEVETFFALRSWWVFLIHKFFSMQLLLFVKEKTNLSPNQLTGISIFFRSMTLFCFLHNTHLWHIAGAIFYFIAYGFDCIDGTLARWTGQTSELGRYLDHLSDLIGDILILCALAFSLGMLFDPLVLCMIFMHIAESYISFLSGFAIKQNQGTSKFYFFKIFNRYRRWWFNKNYKSFFSFTDYTAFVFILMPLLGMPDVGLFIGFYFLFIIVCYTIFSTFVSIFTGESRFP